MKILLIQGANMAYLGLRSYPMGLDALLDLIKDQRPAKAKKK